jgi:hypothetical protein
MFRAFVDEEPRRPAAVAANSGSNTGVIIGAIAVVVVLAAIAWFAFN